MNRECEPDDRLHVCGFSDLMSTLSDIIKPWVSISESLAQFTAIVIAPFISESGAEELLEEIAKRYKVTR